MRNAEFSEVNLAGAKIRGQFSTNETKFSRKVNMASISIGADLLMKNAEYAGLSLNGAMVRGQLSMDGSDFKGPLEMDAVSTGRSLLMRKARFAQVRIVGAKIGGQLAMDGSTFRGRLIMDGVSTVRGLLMKDSAVFAGVRLIGAVVGGQLVMDGATFKGRHQMDTLSVGGDFLMRNAEFAEVDHVGVKIGGQLSMDHSKFRRNFSMDSVSTVRDVFMRKAEFERSANLIFGNIGSNLDASGAKVGKLDLTGTRISGELRLGSPGLNVEWRDYKDESDSTHPPRLLLLNTTVGTLQDTEDTWPQKLELELRGFTYARFGGFGSKEEQTPYTRATSWFVDWLERDATYSPQPYRQLAHVLRRAGYEAKANEILVALQDRRRTHDATPSFTKFLLALSCLLLGYGYEVWRALLWFLGLVVLGSCLVIIARGRNVRDMMQWFFYSLESAVPLVELSPMNQALSTNMSLWVKLYFQIHKIIGLVIVSVLIAGLTGLATQ